MYRYTLWVEDSRFQKEMGKIRAVLTSVTSLILAYPDKKILPAMYLWKIVKEKFHTHPKKTHRDTAGCPDGQTKIPTVKYLTLEKYVVSESENVVTTSTPTKSAEENA